MDGHCRQPQHNSARRNNINTMLMQPRDIDRIAVESYMILQQWRIYGGPLGHTPLTKNIFFTIRKNRKIWFDLLQCYFQLSPGGIPPLQSQIPPPRKTPKIQKTLKNASNLPPPPPDMCFPPPRTWSLELTLDLLSVSTAASKNLPPPPKYATVLQWSPLWVERKKYPHDYFQLIIITQITSCWLQGAIMWINCQRGLFFYVLSPK